MSEPVKIVIPDAGPINTLAAAGLLHLLLVSLNTEIFLIRSVLEEIVVRSPELKAFIDANADRIKIFDTSVCIDDKAKTERGETLGKGRGDLAIADFLLNYIDDLIGRSPGLLITEDRKLLRRLTSVKTFEKNTHFITTAAYLRKLAEEKIIRSFDEIWRLIVDKNASLDPAIDRKPSPEDVEVPTIRRSTIFRLK